MPCGRSQKSVSPPSAFFFFFSLGVRCFSRSGCGFRPGSRPLLASRHSASMDLLTRRLGASVQPCGGHFCAPPEQTASLFSCRHVHLKPLTFFFSSTLASASSRRPSPAANGQLFAVVLFGNDSDRVNFFPISILRVRWSPSTLKSPPPLFAMSSVDCSNIGRQ